MEKSNLIFKISFKKSIENKMSCLNNILPLFPIYKH